MNENRRMVGECSLTNEQIEEIEKESLSWGRMASDQELLISQVVGDLFKRRCRDAEFVTKSDVFVSVQVRACTRADGTWKKISISVVIDKIDERSDVFLGPWESLDEPSVTGAIDIALRDIAECYKRRQSS